MYVVYTTPNGDYGIRPATGPESHPSLSSAQNHVAFLVWSDAVDALIYDAIGMDTIPHEVGEWACQAAYSAFMGGMSVGDFAELILEASANGLESIHPLGSNQ